MEQLWIAWVYLYPKSSGRIQAFGHKTTHVSKDTKYTLQAP